MRRSRAGICAAATKPAQQSIAQKALADGLSSYVTDAAITRARPLEGP